MVKFKAGDKVVCVKDYQDGGWLGMKGVIVKTCGYSGNSISVDFKRKSASGCGHNLSSAIRTDTGWSFSKDSYLQLAKNNQLEFDF